MLSSRAIRGQPWLNLHRFQYMDVSLVKQQYLQLNRKRIDELLRGLQPAQSRAVRCIPLFFHVNYALFPGYVDKDTPAGVYGYKPDERLLDEVKVFSKRFKYDHTRRARRTPVDAVYLHKSSYSDCLVLWILYGRDLAPDDLSKLRRRLENVVTWLQSQQLNIQGELIGSETFVPKLLNDQGSELPVSQSRLLSEFYVESFLLAGKYPVWWLVPPQEEKRYDEYVQNIVAKRFVPPAEFLDFGGVYETHPVNYLMGAIQNISRMYDSMEICWLNLLLLRAQVKAWPRVDNTASRLKRIVHAGKISSSIVVTEEVRAKIIDEIIDDVSASTSGISADRLIRSFNDAPGLMKKGSVNLFSSLYAMRAQKQPVEESVDPFFVRQYLWEKHALFCEISNCFHWLHAQVVEKSKDQREQFDGVLQLSKNLKSFLSSKQGKIPFYNALEKPDVTLSRVVIQHKVKTGGEESWVLAAVEEGGEVLEIYACGQLLALLIWGWLNRVIDLGTSISVDCSPQYVKQIEARQILSSLTKKLPHSFMDNISLDVFASLARPCTSSVFLQYRKDLDYATGDMPLLSPATKPYIYVEQYIVNTWGEVITSFYYGERGLLECLCNWMAEVPICDGEPTKELVFWGYAAGESTSLAQRTQNIYKRVANFFCANDNRNACFVMRLESGYYAMQRENGVIRHVLLGDRVALAQYLEAPRPVFIPIALDREVLRETPLWDIYQRNKPGVVQMFFKTEDTHVQVYILDERGSLFRQDALYYSRQSFLHRWVSLFRFIGNRVHRLNDADCRKPVLEIQQITIGPLGGFEYQAVNLAEVALQVEQLNVRAVVKKDENAERWILICNDYSVDSSVAGDSAFVDFVRYVIGCRSHAQMYPIYITDIDVAFELLSVNSFAEVQTGHYLNYKRKIERHLNSILFNKVKGKTG